MSHEKTIAASGVCTACADIGRELGQNRIVELAVHASSCLQHSDKLRIAVISTHLEGAQNAVEEILGLRVFPKDMNAQNIQNSVDILLTQGEANHAKGAETLLEEMETPATLTWQRESPLLEKMDVELIISRRDFTEFDWKAKLAECDYVFLVTSATALLPASEREFLEQQIRNYLGAPRFALVMSDGAVINSPEDYDMLVGRVNWCLQSLGKNSRFFELGSEEIRRFVQEELADEREALAELAAIQIARVCFMDTKEAVSELAEQAQVSNDELEALMKVLEKRQSTMVHLGEIAASKAHSEITGNIQYSCNKAIARYTDQLYENITNTIRKVEDIDHAADMLPKYLNSAAEQCMAQMQSSIEIELDNLGTRLKEDMIRDAGEFFSEMPFEIVMSDPAGSPSPFGKGVLTNVRLAKDGSDTQKKINFYSKALLIGTIPAFVFGFFPVAIGTAIGSQVIKHVSKDKIDSENKEALLQQIHTICQSLRTDLQNAVSAVLAQMGEEAEVKVKAEYTRFVASVINALAEKKEQVVRAKELQETVKKILEEQLPELERCLA